MSVDLLRIDPREAATVVAIETATQQDAGPQSSGIIPVACVTGPRAGRATLFSGCGKRKEANGVPMHGPCCGARLRRRAAAVLARRWPSGGHLAAIRRRATWPRVSGDKQRRTGWRPDKPGATHPGIGGAA
ncbi:hypothetical protein JR064_21975 [Xanthomonas sp. CFBP 8703]|uniref:Uncharacterized protein n=1 Tax=Xanthomonas bonasiae TaxID=2810351 RepID=A0ABS3BBM1_9XANT|nr:hypothetical protein [Xanthomonas bonasiae]MBN6104836.1 hypothetical protein [Xanthomonas bonasiae]